MKHKTKIKTEKRNQNAKRLCLNVNELNAHVYQVY